MKKETTRWKHEFLKNARRYIAGRCKDILLRTTLEALTYATNHSPVWTGSYVASHRIGHRVADPAPWVDKHDPTALSAAEQPRLEGAAVIEARMETVRREREKLLSKDIKEFDRLVLSNNTPYGMEVELRHSVYAQTEAYARIYMEGLARK